LAEVGATKDAEGADEAGVGGIGAERTDCTDLGDSCALGADREDAAGLAEVAIGVGRFGNGFCAVTSIIFPRTDSHLFVGCCCLQREQHGGVDVRVGQFSNPCGPLQCGHVGWEFLQSLRKWPSL
jgi:hypothetical protein